MYDFGTLGCLIAQRFALSHQVAWQSVYNGPGRNQFPASQIYCLSVSQHKMDEGNLVEKERPTLCKTETDNSQYLLITVPL